MRLLNKSVFIETKRLGKLTKLFMTSSSIIHLILCTFCIVLAKAEQQQVLATERHILAAFLMSQDDRLSSLEHDSRYLGREQTRRRLQLEAEEDLEQSGDNLANEQEDKGQPKYLTPKYTEMPQWMKDLHDLEVIVGQSKIYPFGEPLNFHNERMNVKVRYGGIASFFASFDQQMNHFSVNGNKLTNNFVGEYLIVVSADIVMTNGQKENYMSSFTLKVVSAVEQEKKEEDINPHEPKNVENLPVWEKQNITQIYESFEAEPYFKTKPIPYVIDLSMRGLLTIGWSDWMSVPPDYKNTLNESERVYSNSLKSTINSKIERFWDEQNRTIKEVYSVGTLSVTLKEVQDQEYLRRQIPWKIVDFARDSVLIQLTIPEADADAISQFGDVAKLEVGFWGTDQFQSEKGEAVRFGTMLHWDIYRLASESVLEEVKACEYVLLILLVLLVVFLFTWLFSKKTIAFWMYFNSLMLAAYLPMLDIHVPANVVLLVKPFIDMFRLNLPESLGGSKGEPHRPETEDHNIRSDNPTGSLQSFGYSAYIFKNAPLLLALFALILVIWGITAIPFKDRSRTLQRMTRLNPEIPMCNFLLRFSYQTYLEVSMCVFLSLNARSILIGQAPMQFIISVLLLIAMLSLIAFLCFKIYRGGPYVPGFYDKLTLSSLFCWQTRPVNTAFDHSSWLKKYKELLRAKLIEDSNKFKIKVKAQSSQAKLKPQHSIRIKRNKCQPVNSLESELYTERHLLDTEEGKSLGTDRGGGIGTVPIAIQEIEEEIKITDEKKCIRVEPLNANTAENSDDEHVIDMNQDMIRFKSDSMKSNNTDQKIVYRNSFQHKAASAINLLAQRANQQNITPEFHQKTIQKDQSNNFYEGGEPVKRLNPTELQKYIPEAKKYEPPPEKKAGDPPGDIQVKRIWYRQKAIIGINTEITIPVPNRYKTLFLGLKLNHPKNATVIHPICFLLRRIILALTIVFMRDQSSNIFCLLITMSHTLFMLGYVWNERQWKDSTLNTIHMLNESILYILCLFSVYFCSVESSIESRLTIGWVFMAIFSAQMLGNTFYLLKLFLKHLQMVFKKRYLQRRREHTAKQVLKTMQLLNDQLFNDPLNQSLEEQKKSPPSTAQAAPGATDKKEQKGSLMVPPLRSNNDGLLSLSDIKYQIQPKRTAYGGLQGTFIFSDKQMSFDHISSIMELEQSKQLTPLHVTDMSLVELHKEFQGCTFDRALQDHIGRFLGRSPNIFVDHLDSMSMSQLLSEPRYFEASILASPDVFTAEQMEEREKVPYLREQMTYLQAQQQRNEEGRRASGRQTRKNSLMNYPKLQIVPEQTVEESRFISPSQQKEGLFRRGKDGKNVWALQMFRPAYSGSEAVTKLKEEQEKRAALEKPASAPVPVPTLVTMPESSDNKAKGPRYDSEHKNINYKERSANKALAGQDKAQNQISKKAMELQPIDKFLKEETELDISKQLKRINREQRQRPDSFKNIAQQTPPQQTSINQQEFFRENQSYQSYEQPARPSRRREDSFSDRLLQSNEMSLTNTKQGSMRSLEKLQQKKVELTSSYITDPNPGMIRKREESFSGTDPSENNHFSYLMQQNKMRDIHRESIQSLKKLTMKQKELQSVESQSNDTKQSIAPPAGIYRQREKSYSGILNGDSILSNKLSAPQGGTVPPQIHTQDMDEVVDEGKAQAVFVPPNRLKESSFSRTDGSSVSGSSALSIQQTPIRQKTFISPQGSLQNSLQKKKITDTMQLNIDRVNMTLPHVSSQQAQLIRELPQEEEETVERGKEDRKDSGGSKKHSDSPERHEHESNHDIKKKFIKDQNITSFVNESSYSKNYPAKSSQNVSHFLSEQQPKLQRQSTGLVNSLANGQMIFGGQETAPCKPNQSMHTNMYNQHSSHAILLNIAMKNKNAPKDRVLEHFRQNQNETGQGLKYEDQSKKDPFDSRQNQTLIEQPKFFTIDRRNQGQMERTMLMNTSGNLNSLRHETPMVPKTLQRHGRFNSQELIKEKIFLPIQPRNALFKTRNDNPYKEQQKVKMDIRRMRSSKLVNSGSEIVESQTNKSILSYSNSQQSNQTPQIYSANRKHFYDNNADSHSVDTTSKASLSARTLTKKYFRNQSLQQGKDNSGTIQQVRYRAVETFIEHAKAALNSDKEIQLKNITSQTQTKPEQEKVVHQQQSAQTSTEKPQPGLFSDISLQPKNIPRNNVINILMQQQNQKKAQAEKQTEAETMSKPAEESFNVNVRVAAPNTNPHSTLMAFNKLLSQKSQKESKSSFFN